MGLEAGCSPTYSGAQRGRVRAEGSLAEKAGPRKVWSLTPQEVNARSREAAAKVAAQGQAAADSATITAAVATPPLSGSYPG